MQTQKKTRQRRQKILEMLLTNGHLQVGALSAALEVTPVTLRSDLAALERDGHLLRIHGGAVLPSGEAKQEPAREQVTDDNRTELKKVLATAAAQLVKNGETLLIGSGTTAYYTAVALKGHSNLNVVTNSIPVAIEFYYQPTFRTILLGGHITAQTDPSYAFTYGDEAYEQISKYRADKTILSWDGISIHSGFTTYNAEEAALNKLMMRHAAQTIVVADCTKVGRASFSRVADIESADYLITNKEADPAILSEIKRLGVIVLTC